MTKFFIFSILLFAFLETFSQCNDSLVQIAVSNSGEDVLFLKEFKVKFDKTKTSQPVRVAKYSTFLKAGYKYKFNVANAREYEGRVVLQLFKNSKLKGSTLNLKTQEYKQSFEFYCRRSGSYDILLSFIEGKSGCAVGVLSLIIGDTTEIELPDKNAFLPKEALFMGMKNKLIIESLIDDSYKQTVTANTGRLEYSEGAFYFIADTLGVVTIKAVVKDSSNNIVEELSKEFVVKELPVPYISIQSNPGGLISKDQVLLAGCLSLMFHENIPSDKYKIKSFIISDVYIGNAGKSSSSENFTPHQINFIRNLTEGSNFYIKNVEILMPDGTIKELKTVGYILM